MAQLFRPESAVDEVGGIGELLALLEPPGWHADALCKEHPELNWFPQRGKSAAAARAVCSGCLVRAECAAASAGEKFGVWGGQAIEAPLRSRGRGRGIQRAGSGTPRRAITP